MKDTILPAGGGSDGQFPIFVPAGTPVYYHVHAMHRLESIYGSDASDFRPERWESIRPGWGFLPFNGGPRICLGRKSLPLKIHSAPLFNTVPEQLALNEASYTSVRLLQAFYKIQSPDPEPWQEALAISCGTKNGTQVILTPVEKA